MTDQEFQKANEEYAAFKADLKAVFNKHNCKYIERDQYDGSDDYMGVEMYFEINGVSLVRETVQEVIEELLPKGHN